MPKPRSIYDQLSGTYDPQVKEQGLPGENGQDVPSSIYDQLPDGFGEPLTPDSWVKRDRSVGREFFTEEWQFRGFPDDFLIINDVIMDNVPTTAISTDSEASVTVAETLRSKAPVVSSSGVQNITVSLSLVFPSGRAQSEKLQRLIAELRHHPLVYIYNGKIRRSLGITDPSITTMFIVESGTLRSDPDHIGSIILDLTLHYFNYKPFSRHFWYNTNLPWINKPQAELIDQELFLGDLTGYEASAYSLGYEAEKLARDIRAGSVALSLDNPNIPVNIPAASDAWMYYADYLSRITETVRDDNSDYIGFSLRAFEYHTPPTDAERAGKGLLADLFAEEDGSFVPYSSVYNANPAALAQDNRTFTENTVDYTVTDEPDSVPLGTGHSWEKAREDLFEYGETPWKNDGALTPDIHLSEHLKDESGYVYSYRGASKCNIMLCETLYRSGYKVPTQRRSRGRGYPGVSSLLSQVRSPNLKWGIRLTGKTREEIQRVIDTGVPVALLWDKPAHTLILTKIFDIEYTAEKKIKSIRYEGYDQNSKEKQKARRTLAKQLGFELVQAIPSDTLPPNKNPLGALRKDDRTIEAIAKLRQKAGSENQPIPNEDRRRIEARRKWLEELRQEGVYYYDEDPKVRNVFFQDLEYHISSSPDDQRIPEYGKQIVCSAASVTFGHRIVPQKLLSQDTYTWQFLGAGNRTGTIVFTFSGESGRISANRIKKLIFRARENARQFQGVIPSAGALRFRWDNPNGQERNTILSLLGIRDFIVTDFTEASVPDSADQHQLIVNFIAQDFAEEKLDRNIITSFDQKKRVIQALMGYLTSYYIDTIDRGFFSGERVVKKRKIIPDPNHVVYRGLEAEREKKLKYHTDAWVGGEGRYWKTNPSSDIPGWLAEILVEVAETCQWANENSPSALDVSDRQKGLYREWGASEFITGDRKNNKYKKSLPSFIGRTSAYNYTYNSSENVVLDQPANEDSFNRVYLRWLDLMNISFNKIMNNVHAEDFGRWFGRIGDDVIESLTSRIGECYDDLMLPDVPQGNIPLSPEFYVYDDSYEDAAISSLTDENNMEQFLQRHIRNERASVKRYIQDTILGGSYVSRNLPRIMESRREYLNSFAGETRDRGETYFMTWSQRLAEGTRSWEPVFYRPADSTYQEAHVKKWMDRVSNGREVEEAQFDFLDDLISLSSYLRDGRGELWNQPYNSSNKAELVETLYSDNWRKLSFGPNPNYRHADEILSGNIPDTRSDLATAEVTKTPEELLADKVHRQAAGFTSSYTILSDGAIAFGDDEDESKALSNDRSTSIGTDILSSVSSFFGTFVEPIVRPLAGISPVLFGASVLNTAVAAKELATEDRNLAAVQKDIGELLPNLDHKQAQRQFSPDKEDATLAAMMKGIAFGTKSKDLSLRRAYPTFKIYFIEEDEQGSEVVDGRMIRAFDDFYSSSAVQEIRIIRSRKVAADLAILRITNIGGKLLRRRFGETSQWEQEEKVKYGVEAEYETGIFADTERENPFERMVLQDGVKVQIRLGYASNPDHLESVFLGSIVEISPVDDGKLLEIVCQGFGAELEGVELGPLEDGPVFYSSQQVLSGAIIQDSIVNFGRRGKYKRFTPGEQRHSFTGGRGLGWLDSFTPTQLLEQWSNSRLYRHYFKYSFRNYPQDDNIFAPPPHVYTSTWQRFWNNACTYRPLKQTPWQIFKEHELRHPGYVAMALPYGHSPRMTMFFGSKAQHYWSKPPSGLELFLAENAAEQIIRLRGLNPKQVENKDFASKLKDLSLQSPGLADAVIKGISTFSAATGVSQELGKLFGRYRPFRNFHYFDSKHHILKNSIRTNRDGTFNEVEVLYFKDENDIDPESGFLGLFGVGNDASELAENIEAMQRGEEGILACKLDENIPEEYIRSYREEFPSCITTDMARRYIQGLFARLLRDCYQGDLIVMGDESLRPYDICYLNDSSINMTGPIEVEQVEHVFNRDLGFVSIITPDLCVDINDYYSATVLDLAGASLAYTFGLDDPDTAIAMTALASPLGFLGWTGGVKFLKWTQEGVPVITTPLVLEGKPFMSVTLGQKRTSLLLSLNGRWRQYWDDLETAWDKFDLAESFFDQTLSWSESVLGFLGSGSGGESIPEVDY